MMNAKKDLFTKRALIKKSIACYMQQYYDKCTKRPTSYFCVIIGGTGNIKDENRVTKQYFN